MVGSVDDAQVVGVMAAILLLGMTQREGRTDPVSGGSSTWGDLPSGEQAADAVRTARQLLVLARTQHATEPDPLAG